MRRSNPVRVSRGLRHLGLTARTVQRWREQGEQGFDVAWSEGAPVTSSARRAKEVLDVANRPEYRDLSPNRSFRGWQTRTLPGFGVHLLPDLARGGCAAPPRTSRPRSVPDRKSRWRQGRARSARGTSLTCERHTRGVLLPLPGVDVWSRKIVGWAVHDEESMELAARLIDDTATRLGCDLSGWFCIRTTAGR